MASSLGTSAGALLAARVSSQLLILERTHLVPCVIGPTLLTSPGLSRPRSPPCAAAAVSASAATGSGAAGALVRPAPLASPGVVLSPPALPPPTLPGVTGPRGPEPDGPPALALAPGPAIPVGPAGSPPVVPPCSIASGPSYPAAISIDCLIATASASTGASGSLLLIYDCSPSKERCASGVILPKFSARLTWA